MVSEWIKGFNYRCRVKNSVFRLGGYLAYFKILILLFRRKGQGSDGQLLGWKEWEITKGEGNVLLLVRRRGAERLLIEIEILEAAGGMSYAEFIALYSCV